MAGDLARGKDYSWGSFHCDTDNLITQAPPSNLRSRKGNRGTESSMGGSGQHPSMTVSAFTAPDYIGRNIGSYTRAKQ